MNLPKFLCDHPDGEIRLKGHRIGLYTIVRDYQEGMTADQMAEEYPTLSRDLLDNVIQFYLQNRTAVDTYLEEYREKLDRLKVTLPQKGPDLEELKRRWIASGREPFNLLPLPGKPQ